jgi:hypothetical protein
VFVVVVVLSAHRKSAALTRVSESCLVQCFRIMRKGLATPSATFSLVLHKLCRIVQDVDVHDGVAGAAHIELPHAVIYTAKNVYRMLNRAVFDPDITFQENARRLHSA